jgi:hypothetical protein
MRTITRTTRTPATATAIAALFAGQLGLATPAQLRAVGVTITEQRARIERGEWEVWSPGVIGLCGVPDDWRRRPMAATLGSARVAVTGPTALRLHGLDGFRDETGLYVVARMADHPRLPDDCHLWRSRRFEDDADVTLLDGIRTTIAPTALVHAAPIVEADRFGKALDDLLRRSVSPAWVQGVADRWNGRGVPGSSVLSAALAERCDGRLPRSWFERLARRSLAAHGIEMEHEIPVFDGTRRIAVLDLADRRLKVAVECQSWAWHATPAARRADARRKARLRRLGWDVTELWWSDRSRMPEIVDDIREAIRRQRILLA